MTYILQNFLAKAQLEILLAQQESWRLGLKAGVSTRKLETGQISMILVKLQITISLFNEPSLISFVQL